MALTQYVALRMEPEEVGAVDELAAAAGEVGRSEMLRQLVAEAVAARQVKAARRAARATAR
jgi:hypothetical protein